MTASRPAPPLRPALSAVGAAPARRRGLAGVALAAAAALVAAGAATPRAAASGPMTRVVVSAVDLGTAGVFAAAQAVRAAGGQVVAELPLVFGVAADLPADAQMPPGVQVAPDRPVRVSGGSAVPVDAPASPVRQTLGLGAPAGEGRGITVAVVDTGVEPVPDLAGRLTQVDVTDTGRGDGYGHGTFVAGLVAGSGAASGGRYAGVAPAARLLSVRVADAQGRTDLVTVLRGLQVAAARGADVVNLSLSSDSPLPWQLDPLTLALTSLWDRGTVVVVPAGNDGPGPGTVNSPGVAPALLTVGALDEQATGVRADDTVAPFSARGPAPQGVAKPELIAPGRSVVSLRDPGSVIDRSYGNTAAVGASYFTGSGTSFSTAVAAGAAAVLLGDRRLTPDQVKALLMGTAYRAAGLRDPAAAGAGGLDLAAARRAPAPTVAANSGTGSADDRNESDRSGAMSGGADGGQGSSRSDLPAELAGQVAGTWSALPEQLRSWLAGQWDGRNWAGRNWAGRNWAGRNWAGRNWAGRNWAGRNWAGRNWGASSWSARSWAASSWS